MASGRKKAPAKAPKPEPKRPAKDRPKSAKKRRATSPADLRRRAGRGKPVGPPTTFTEPLFQHILREMADQGRSLTAICKDDGMPAKSTFFYWLQEYPALVPRYENAMACRATGLLDAIPDIADDGTNDYVERQRKDGSTFVAFDKEAVMRSRLRAEARFRLAEMTAPHKYGRMLRIAGSKGGPVEHKHELAGILDEIDGADTGTGSATPPPLTPGQE